MENSTLKLLLKTVVIICASVFVLFLAARCTPPEHRDPSSAHTDVVFLSTTDMHGKCWETNLQSLAPEPHNMLRVSTAVDSIREAYGRENVILIDNGDLFQGEIISELGLINNENASEPGAPMALCITEIGYDAFVVGNHEFDYDWNTMKQIYDHFEDSGVPVLSANTLYDGSDGIHADDENVFRPYITKTITVNGTEHTIGILGLGNTDIPRWDSPENFPGMKFVHDGNDSFSMAEEARMYISEMREAGCEFIVVSYHGGLANDEVLEYGTNTSHQVHRLIADTEGIDFAIVGHDHNSTYSNTYFKNPNGEDILLVNGGGEELTESVFRFSEDESGRLKWEIVSSENLELKNYEADKELQEKIRPYAAEAETAVNEPIGRLTGSWDGNSMMYTEQTDTTDLVLKSMMHSGEKELRKQYGGNEQAFYDAYHVDHMTIDVPITTVSVRDDYIAKPGTISMRDVCSLYRYTNLLIVLPLKGSKIRAMMEENAAERLTARVLNGKPYIYDVNDDYTDLLFGGINFTYDFAKEKGQRVNITGLADGREFQDDAVYLVVASDYLVANDKCGLRDYSEDDNLIDKEVRIADGVAEYISETSMKSGGVSTDAFNWHWKTDYIMTNENTEGHEGEAYASLAEKPENGKTYVLVHEPTGTAVVEEEETLKVLEVKTLRNDIIEPLPANAVLFTVQYAAGSEDSSDRITLRNPKGEYLTCDKLIWTDDPENSCVEWQLDCFNGAWRIISTEELADGRKKAMEVYNASLTTYDYSGMRCAFCFNFYEPAEN